MFGCGRKFGARAAARAARASAQHIARAPETG
jgi:hypothetical protein